MCQEVWAVVGYRGCARNLWQDPAGTQDRTSDSYLRGVGQAVGKCAFSRGQRCSLHQPDISQAPDVSCPVLLGLKWGYIRSVVSSGGDRSSMPWELLL